MLIDFYAWPAVLGKRLLQVPGGCRALLQDALVASRTLRLLIEIGTGEARGAAAATRLLFAPGCIPGLKQKPSRTAQSRIDHWLGEELATLLVLMDSSCPTNALTGASGSVNAVAFSPDGRHLVSGSDDRTLRLWELAGGTSRVLEGHGDWVRAVVFSPDGRHQVSGSGDRTLRLWEVASGTSRVLEGHGDPVRAVAFSPDGRHLVSGSDDKTLWLREVASGQEIAFLDGDFPFLSLALNGKSLIAGDGGGRVHLIDILIDEADKTAWLARWRG